MRAAQIVERHHAELRADLAQGGHMPGDPTFEGWLVILESEIADVGQAAGLLGLASNPDERHVARDACERALARIAAAATEAIATLNREEDSVQ